MEDCIFAHYYNHFISEETGKERVDESLKVSQLSKKSWEVTKLKVNEIDTEHSPI